MGSALVLAATVAATMALAGRCGPLLPRATTAGGIGLGVGTGRMRSVMLNPVGAVLAIVVVSPLLRVGVLPLRPSFTVVPKPEK